MQYKALKDSAALKQARDVRVEIWWGPEDMARLIGPDKRVVVNQCTQWKRYSTLGQLRGERTILLDEFKWESWPIDTMKRLMDKWPGAPCEVLQQIRRVASCHNLAEQFPGYFVQRCDRPGPGGIPPQSTPDSLP